MNFVENYEKIHFVNFSSTKRTSRKLKNKKFKIIIFTINNLFVENKDDKINDKLQILVQILLNIFQFAKIVTKNRVDDFAFFVLNINAMSLKRDRDCFKKNIKL